MFNNQHNLEAKLGKEEISCPKLKPRHFSSLGPAKYIAERFNDSISWYDKKAVLAKSRYQYMRAITVVAGALVPVLVNLKSETLGGLISGVTTIVSVIVVVLVALESVFHFRE